MRIDLKQILNASAGTYENVGRAFGGAGSMSVSMMLAYAASKSYPGGTNWYDNVKDMQELAKDAFEAINSQIAFAN